MKLRDLAERLNCRLEAASGDAEIVRVAGIETAQPGDLTFLASPRYRAMLAKTGASAVILGHDDASAAPCAVLRSDDPYLTFTVAIGLFRHAPQPPRGIDPLSSIAPDAVVGPDVSIGPFVAVGAGARIGARTVIHPNVVVGAHSEIGDDCLVYSQVAIREGVVIGNRVVLHCGAVLGSDGFGFIKRRDGSHLKIPQYGDVVVEDDAEIGANTAIDRPPVGETRIRAGAKIDNLVQIAHGVSIGRRAVLAAQVGIAGSAVIEDDVVLAGQVGVSDHVRLGKGVVATAQTGIPNSVEAGQFISGYPAISNRDWLKSSAVFHQLPTLKRRVAQLEARIAELEEKLIECRTRLDR